MTGDVVELAYPERTPIATCHWRWVANVLAMRGHPGYWERLGLAWGVQWRGGSVLFGSMTWEDVLAEASGIVVSIRTFPNARDAFSWESELAADDVPVIVEVDGFHLPAPTATDPAHVSLGSAFGFPAGHVVKAILVTGRGLRTVRAVDMDAGPQVVDLTVEEYRRARSAPCGGRAEPFKSYALMRGPGREAPPRLLLDLVRDRLTRDHADSQRALAAYTQWAGEVDGRLDVCRVAGERYQATRFFEYLVARGISEARRPAELFVELTDAWYMLHMLAMHESAVQPRHRRRLIRMLEQLADKESTAAQAVLG